MAGHANGSNWHNANGGGLAYRPPPTVDEAAMYSPFVSIIPFSPEVIPFPAAEPPTPPSTLTPDQHNAAKRAVGILNDEIKGQTTAQHLHDTLRQLQRLLHRDKLPEYNFKPMPQLATPPPDSPAKEHNGTAASDTPALSPFASMLLRQTDVSFTPNGVLPPEPRQLATPARPAATPSQTRTPSLPQVETPNGTAHAQTGHLPFPSSALSSVPNSTPPRPGPAVVVKPISGRREEYQRYDDVVVDATPSLPQKRQEQTDRGLAALKPHEREIADRKIEELRDLVASLTDDKDDLEGSDSFRTVPTLDADFTVMRFRAMDNLSDKMSNIINLGRFSALPVDMVMDIQSLLQPGVTSAIKNDLFKQAEETIEWSDSIEAAKFALKAAKMILDTMIEGRDDYRMRREEMIDTIIDLIKFIKDACIVPILQARRSGSTEDVFISATGQKRELQTVLRLCGSVMSRCAMLIGKYNLSDRALNGLEYLALELVMEQNSDSEKDSIFTIQKFEQFRQKAVDVLAEIFARHAEQQNSILNGVLSNLEKLPDKKASARQFKSARDVPIMTISALFMRFVQVAATNRESQTKTAASNNNENSSDEDASDYDPGTSSTKKRKKRNDAPAQTAQLLFKRAKTIAYTIAAFLVDRASNVSKTSDKPFRNLLDLFIEDFCNVLGSPEWPGAELLLEQVMRKMNALLQAEQTAKTTVNDKDMALSVMSRIGCGILDFKHRLKKLKREKLDVSQSNISSKLDRLLDEAMSDNAKEGVNDLDLLAFDGPYRMVIESLPDYLDLHSSQDDPRLQSVSGCHVTLWLAAFLRAFPADAGDADARPLAVAQLRERLDLMIMDHKWLSQKFKFQSISEVQSKLAAGIITMQNNVCKYVPYIVALMLEKTLDKNSSKLRSRGMTGLEQLIHKDPRVFTERNVKDMISAFSDTSPMVRESTLSLVSTCLEHQPSLQQHFLSSILQLANDPSNGPKKKAIKLLKDIYNGPSSMDDKLRIIAALLLPSQDDEKTISELARNVLEEIILVHNKPNARLDESQLKLERSKRSLLIINTVQHIHATPKTVEAFEKLFAHALSPGSANIEICKELVADMVDQIISPETGSDTQSQARIMTALSIFAKVEPSLFTVDQLQLLKLYIKVLTTTEDLALVRPTVIIFRYVFTTLSTLQVTFAEEVRASLMSNVSKLATLAVQKPESRETLVDIAHCLWALTPMADQGLKKLCTLILSVICQLRPLSECTKEEATKNQKKIQSYAILLGTFGKVCSFDKNIEIFRETLEEQARKNRVAQTIKLSGDSKTAVSLLLLNTVRPFTSQAWDMSVRVQALKSVGDICQGSPSLFMRAEIEKVFKLVFINGDNDLLRQAALVSFREYFTFAERRSESGAEIAVGKGAVTGNARLETSFVANENDSATLHIAQRFLQNFVDTALKYNNDLGVSATFVIASISRQGLVHPKECGAALVALGTSPIDIISQTASVEHKRIHEKQESYLEKEYMQSVRMAYDYQVDVFGDSHGMREATYGAKLGKLFEALKSGKKVTFKKFINNLCKQVDFNFAKLDASGEPPSSVLFARFCLENLALIDLATLEEVAMCLSALEAIVLKNTGPTVALAIETEMPKRFVNVQEQSGHGDFQQHLGLGDAAGFQAPITMSQLEQPTINETRLRQITAACMILRMVWETRAFIRRCYNVQKTKGGIPQKDYIKPAQRNNFVSGKELWESLLPVMHALDSRETMIKACYDFADILDVDREAQIGEDGEDDDLGAGYETPDEGDVTAPFPTSGRGRKRKSNMSLGNTPKKARGRPTGGKNKKRSSKTPDADGDSD
ncbi:sister chromatid cohesion protein [Parastagonospora nodorum]|nr:sister chromatid cohesion protein [Parastagonospora nodorum]KAH5396884.1 sister chromatid cohesion protein [Parastagonospora nodorum]KAH6215428.1 sister chromatid cohesion protein [Parastagonospora nodorum]KAH6253974.1 sister chromatid cohesion protein [Parastagonospora nodorum]